MVRNHKSFAYGGIDYMCTMRLLSHWRPELNDLRRACGEWVCQSVHGSFEVSHKDV